MKLKNFGRVFLPKAISTAMFLLLCGLTALIVTGCDEGMDLIINDPITNPGGKDTGNTGEMKDPGEQDPGESEVSTIAIEAVIDTEDGTMIVSGISTELPEGTTVTVTLGDTVTATTTVDETGAWSATVSAKKVATLAAGVVTITATAGKAKNTTSIEHTPPEPPEPTPPELTVTIETVSDEDGAITVSGTSANLPTGETVTITVGGTITVTATTDKTGAWSVTVLAADAAQLSTGTVMVTATAKNIAEDERSFEHTAPEPEEEPAGHGIVTHTTADRIKLDIVIAVSGYDDSTATEKERRLIKIQYNSVTSQYGSLFDVETEVGKQTFQRFVEYYYKKLALAESGNFDGELLDQYYGEAYGFSVDFAISLVHDVYLKEKPEDKELLSTGWQVFGIGMEYLLLQIANPDASDEELIELLRESIRTGNVSIAS